MSGQGIHSILIFVEYCTVTWYIHCELSNTFDISNINSRVNNFSINL